MIIQVTKQSRMYETLAQAGVLYTAQSAIDTIRQNSAVFNNLDLSDDDIFRVSYVAQHFRIDAYMKDYMELWLSDGTYINPAAIKWIQKNETEFFGVLPNRVADGVTLKYYYNPNIVFRYSATGTGVYTKNFDNESDPYFEKYLPNMTFFISGNTVISPQFTITDTNTLIRAEYTDGIDLIICTNLAHVIAATANTTFYIDMPDSPNIYTTYIVNHDDSYPIDAKFYPCARIDKTAIVRVYKDSCREIADPYAARLLNYPEFIDIDDPYETSHEMIASYVPAVDVIDPNDSDAVILQKFANISKECYRLGENFQKRTDNLEFVTCDNSDEPNFIVINLHTSETEYQTVVYSVVPYEPTRDVMIYKGEIFSDYTLLPVKLLSSGMYSNDPINGKLSYTFSTEYDPDQFTLIKFNSSENTSITNASEFLNTSNLLNLHSKLNKFYNNLLFLRRTILDVNTGDQVYVGTDAPIATDHDWFKLLTTANLADFESKVITMNLNPSNISGQLIDSIYSLNLPTDGGTANYSTVLQTYCSLSEADKANLVLQNGDGELTADVEGIVVDSQSDITDAELNELLIDFETGDGAPTGGLLSGTIGTTAPTNPSLGALHFDTSAGEDLYSAIAAAIASGISTVSIYDPTSELLSLGITNDSTETQITEALNQLTRSEQTDIIINMLASALGVTLDVVTRNNWEAALVTLDDDHITTLLMKLLITRSLYEAALTIPATGTVDPANLDEYRTQLFNLVMSSQTPEQAAEGNLWVTMDAVPIGEIVADILSNVMYECGATVPADIASGAVSAVVFDYGSNSDPNSVDYFREVQTKLNTVTSSATDPGITDNRVWYKWLDSVVDKVVYSDDHTMLMDIDDHLYAIQFADDDVNVFAFDDIVMNFKNGNRGIRYLSILADLYKSGRVPAADMTIFYKRLITDKDQFDPKLARVYTGTSNVVAGIKLDMDDLTIAYSLSVGRKRIDYNECSEQVQFNAWCHVIDFEDFEDFTYMPDRMLMFINGKFIKNSDIEDMPRHLFKVSGFDEVVSIVDIFYSKSDLDLIKLKQVAESNAPTYTLTTPVDVTLLREMEPITIVEYSHKGFYDVLYNEYLANGRLDNLLSYYEDNPSEFKAFKDEFIGRFTEITGQYIFDDFGDKKIVLCGSGEDATYKITQ